MKDIKSLFSTVVKHNTNYKILIEKKYNDIGGVGIGSVTNFPNFPQDRQIIKHARGKSYLQAIFVRTNGR